MKTDNHQLICNSCGKDALARIHRGKLVKAVLGWLPLKKYKCLNCLKNYYIFGNQYKIRSL